MSKKNYMTIFKLFLLVFSVSFFSFIENDLVTNQNSLKETPQNIGKSKDAELSTIKQKNKKTKTISAFEFLNTTL